jgi:hypothetical protein
MASIEVPKILEITRNNSTRLIVDSVPLYYGQMIPLRQARRVKAWLLHDTFAQQWEQFCLLHAYLEALPKTNNEVYHFPQVDEVNFQLHRDFICPQQSRGSFAMSLPIIAL